MFLNFLYYVVNPGVQTANFSTETRNLISYISKVLFVAPHVKREREIKELSHGNDLHSTAVYPSLDWTEELLS